MAVLLQNNYGKSQVRLLKVRRTPGRHEVFEWTVAIRLEGDFEAAHRTGDNTLVLPTDTMKNTVYALAADTTAETPEAFGLELARFLLGRNPQVRQVEVDLAGQPWSRMAPGGAPHEHAFTAVGGETRDAFIHLDRNESRVDGGLGGVTVMKTTKSAFFGYPRDEFTTLPETRDRIFRTILSARWRYREGGEAGFQRHADIRRSLLDTFAAHDSLSVQETLFAMGAAALAAAPELLDIRLSLPNRHCLPVNLEPFGRKNRNEIFVVTDEPYGLIEATVGRG